MNELVPLAMLLALGTGCEPDVGPCEPTEARRLVYDDSGSPAYEGQATLIRSCGFGAFCHSSLVEGDDRYGAPIGLDYDLRLIGADGVEEDTSYARLEAAHQRTFAHRRAIWASIQAGTMPIGGEVGTDVAGGAPVYVAVDASGGAVPVPTLAEPEGRERFRNWLACGLPLVQSAAPLEMNRRALGDVASPVEVTPLEPRWGDIHDRLIARRCASVLACHGAGARTLQLDGGPAAALEALIDVAASGDDCRGEGGALITPGDPDASLLVHKLRGYYPGVGTCATTADCAEGSFCVDDACAEPVCGDFMPTGGSRLSPTSLAAVRTWIANGASAD